MRQARSSSKKKSLIYLANDVLQNGIKKKTSYSEFFLPKLPIAFASFGICDQDQFSNLLPVLSFRMYFRFISEFYFREQKDKRLLKTLMNVLLVWENRNVFAPEYVKALRGALFAEQRKQLQQCIEVSISCH